MKLIHTETDFDTVLVLNHKQHSFCSLFDYSENAEFILIFNDLTENDYALISGLNQKKNSSNPQKLLFIGHILFDYQKVLQKLIAVVDPALILVLVDNNKSPFLITERDIKYLSPILLNVINYQNQGVIGQKTKSNFNIKSLFKVILFQFLKLFLKPIQSFKDLYSTYNFKFFYGKLRIFFVKAYFMIRHISAMSFIYSKSMTSYTKGYLEWCYYRLEWCYYRLEWCYYRLEWCYFKIHEFNMNYTFYPVRKFFWFVNFQYKKRILKKI